MLKRNNVQVRSNPFCEKSVDNLDPDDFLYFDKDGFELNVAEQKFYSAMKFPIDYPILNHCCWQEPWFELESDAGRLILDHSMILCRTSYQSAARQQLEEIKTKVPQASMLLSVKNKWGYDFALDAVSDTGDIFEVIHIEYDSTNYEKFISNLINFEWSVRHIDWLDAADRIWSSREKWKHLKGFEQNNWKSNFILGLDRAEHIEKAMHYE